MFGTRTEYDHGVNTFDPRGKLLQVEYAIEAVKLGSTAIGIQTAEGVVLAVEKRINSSLLVASSVKKLVKLDAHIGCAMSGLVADARTLIDLARTETQNHWFTYNEQMQIKSVVQCVSDVCMGFGEGSMARPYGVSLLVGGVDENGPALYHTDPAGTMKRFQAKAIGSGCEGAQTQLQEHYNKSMKIHEAQKLALEVLKQVMEEKINETNVELASIVALPEDQVSPVNGHGVFQVATSEEKKAIISTLSADVL